MRQVEGQGMVDNCKVANRNDLDHCKGLDTGSWVRVIWKILLQGRTAMAGKVVKLTALLCPYRGMEVQKEKVFGAGD